MPHLLAHRVAHAVDAVGGAGSLDALAAVETEVLGKRSPLNGFKKQVGGLDADGRRSVGQALNAARERVEAAVAAQLKLLPRADVAGASWEEFGAIILVESLAAAVPLVDAIAPEHLEIVARQFERLADKVRNTGAIFLGAHTPEAIGDYVAGSNHVLPTARSARFSSGLGVLDFMKRTSILKCGPDGLAKLAPAAIELAQAEGLAAHARSVAIRLNRR